VLDEQIELADVRLVCDRALHGLRIQTAVHLRSAMPANGLLKGSWDPSGSDKKLVVHEASAAGQLDPMRARINRTH